MPQLDLLTFFPQFFWTSVIFLVFYILIVQKILPKIAFILKTRALINNYTNLGNEQSLNLSSLDSTYKSLVIPSDINNLTSPLFNFKFSNYFSSLTSVLKKQSFQSNNTLSTYPIITLFKGLKVEALTRSSSPEQNIKEDKPSKKKQNKSSKKTK